MRDPKRTCEHCSFYAPGDEHVGQGQCRRWPPKLVVLDRPVQVPLGVVQYGPPPSRPRQLVAVPMHPEVAASHWCGEHG